MSKLNNGYVLLVHYSPRTINPRVFGPFRTPAEALRLFQQGLKLKIQCDRPERPVMSRHYKITNAKGPDDPETITIETLECWDFWSRVKGEN